MRKITAAQQRKLHVLSRELGMDNDLLHEYVFMMTEKESLKELTLEEAVRVIDGLEGKKDFNDGSHVTYRQLSYIFSLVKKLGWTDEEGNVDEKRLNGFVKKQYGVQHYKWMSRKVASNVIEGLKKLSDRKVMNA